MSKYHSNKCNCYKLQQEIAKLKEELKLLTAMSQQKLLMVDAINLAQNAQIVSTFYTNNFASVPGTTNSIGVIEYSGASNGVGVTYLLQLNDTVEFNTTSFANTPTLITGVLVIKLNSDPVFMPEIQVDLTANTSAISTEFVSSVYTVSYISNYVPLPPLTQLLVKPFSISSNLSFSFTLQDSPASLILPPTSLPNTTTIDFTVGDNKYIMRNNDLTMCTVFKMEASDFTEGAPLANDTEQITFFIYNMQPFIIPMYLSNQYSLYINQGSPGSVKITQLAQIAYVTAIKPFPGTSTSVVPRSSGLVNIQDIHITEAVPTFVDFTITNSTDIIVRWMPNTFYNPYTYTITANGSALSENIDNPLSAGNYNMRIAIYNIPPKNRPNLYDTGYVQLLMGPAIYF